MEINKYCAGCKDLRIKMQMMMDDMKSGACCDNDDPLVLEKDYAEWSNKVTLSLPIRSKKEEDHTFEDLLGIFFIGDKK